MAHFSPVNGAFPHKNQIDRTCVVAFDEQGEYAKIERGSIICVNEQGKFELAANASKKPLYISLQDYDDTQAAMAGEVGFGQGEKIDGKWPAYGQAGAHIVGDPPNDFAAHENAPVGQPAVTGLSFQEHGNYQTDMYDKTRTDYTIGAPLTVKGGLFTTEGVNASNTVAYVYAAPFMYYANDAVCKRNPAMKWSTGAYIRVLRVSIA